MELVRLCVRELTLSAMAILIRNIFFPSVPVDAFPSTPLTVSSQSFVSLPLSSPPCSYPLHTKPRRPTSPFSCSFSAVAVGTPELELDAKQDSTDVGEEVSKTRLIAQNVPWSCTPEDIRSLFEKYGTVVDVEVSECGTLLVFDGGKFCFLKNCFTDLNLCGLFYDLAIDV